MSKWLISSISESTFKRVYKKVQGKREKVTITIYFETTNTLRKANTIYDVHTGDVVSVLINNELLFGIVKSVKHACFPSTIYDVQDAYYDSSLIERAALEEDDDIHEIFARSSDTFSKTGDETYNYITERQKAGKMEKPEFNRDHLNLFDKITEEDDDYYEFHVAEDYHFVGDVPYETREGFAKTKCKMSYFTKKKVMVGDLAVFGLCVAVIRLVNKRTSCFSKWAVKEDAIFFKGNGDPEGKEVLYKFFEERRKRSAVINSIDFIKNTNNISLKNYNEGEALLADGNKATFKICRNLEDIKNNIIKYHPEMKESLISNNEYQDSFFASNKVIESIKDNYDIRPSFDGSFDFLLANLVNTVFQYGLIKDKDKYPYPNIELPKSFPHYYAGVNLNKNFLKHHKCCFSSAPFFIPLNKNLTEYFNCQELEGWTFYNYAKRKDIVKYVNDLGYSESYGYYSKGGEYELKFELVESYAVLLLNGLPPVFYQDFFEENIIFEKDGLFFAYYVFRENSLSNYLDSIRPFNNPIESMHEGEFIYGIGHSITSYAFDGAFHKDCHQLDDIQCKAIYYFYHKYDEIPSVNEYFLQDDTGIYSKDGAILYFASPKKGRSYRVRNGVKEIRAYALAYLDKCISLEIPYSVTKIGELDETSSKSKKPILSHLKTLYIPDTFKDEKDLIVKYISGQNIKTREIKEISVIFTK